MNRLLCIVPLALALGNPARALAAPPPVEAYGNLESVSMVSINPAGERLAWVVNDGQST